MSYPTIWKETLKRALSLPWYQRNRLEQRELVNIRAYPRPALVNREKKDRERNPHKNSVPDNVRHAGYLERHTRSRKKDERKSPARRKRQNYEFYRPCKKDVWKWGSWPLLLAVMTACSACLDIVTSGGHGLGTHLPHQPMKRTSAEQGACRRKCCFFSYRRSHR